MSTKQANENSETSLAGKPEYFENCPTTKTLNAKVKLVDKKRGV